MKNSQSNTENDTTNPETPTAIFTDLRPVYKFYPLQSRGSFIESFFSLVADEFRNIGTNQSSSKNNLTKGESLALKELTNNQEIIIKSVDNGGGGGLF